MSIFVPNISPCGLKYKCFCNKPVCSCNTCSCNTCSSNADSVCKKCYSNKCSCPEPCGCKIRVDAKCVDIGIELGCLGIQKGDTLEKALQLINEQCEKESPTFNPELANIGSGEEVYAGQDTDGVYQFRTLVSPNGSINIEQQTTEINFDINETWLLAWLQANSCTIKGYLDNCICTPYTFTVQNVTNTSINITIGNYDVNDTWDVYINGNAVQTGITAQTTTIANLTANTTYSITIRRHHGTLTCDSPAQNHLTTGQPPCLQYNVSVTNIDYTSFEITVSPFVFNDTWSVFLNGSTVSVQQNINQASIVLSGLNPNTTYNFTVVRDCATGGTATTGGTAVTLDCVAYDFSLESSTPENVVISILGTVTDPWQYSLDGGNSWIPSTVPYIQPPTSTQTITGLPPTIYDVRVRRWCDITNGVSSVSPIRKWTIYDTCVPYVCDIVDVTEEGFTVKILNYPPASLWDITVTATLPAPSIPTFQVPINQSSWQFSGLVADTNYTVSINRICPDGTSVASTNCTVRTNAIDNECLTPYVINFGASGQSHVVYTNVHIEVENFNTSYTWHYELREHNGTTWLPWVASTTVQTTPSADIAVAANTNYEVRVVKNCPTAVVGTAHSFNTACASYVPQLYNITSNTAEIGLLNYASGTWDLSIDGGTTFALTGLTGATYTITNLLPNNTYNLVVRRACTPTVSINSSTLGATTPM